MTYLEIMLLIIKLFLLFMSGSLLGWAIEIFWRRLTGKARRWINPGFLSGPWLPLYGFGTICLYYISDLPKPPIPFIKKRKEDKAES